MRAQVVAAVGLAVVVAIAASGRAAEAQNLVVNGSFETGPNPGSFTTLTAHSRTIPGWSVTGVTVDYIGSFWRASDGARSVDLDGSPGPGGIVQQIATRPGVAYLLSFMLSGNDGCAPTLKRMEARAGSVRRRFTFDVSTGSAQRGTWVRRTLAFTAVAARSTIALRSLDATSNCGAVVDDVRVIVAAR